MSVRSDLRNTYLRVIIATTMPPRFCRNLALLAMLITIAAVLLWLNSFKLEYFPSNLFLFKWHPTRRTPQFQCVWLISAPATIIFALGARRARRPP